MEHSIISLQNVIYHFELVVVTNYFIIHEYTTPLYTSREKCSIAFELNPGRKDS